MVFANWFFVAQGSSPRTASRTKVVAKCVTACPNSRRTIFANGMSCSAGLMSLDRIKAKVTGTLNFLCET